MPTSSYGDWTRRPLSSAVCPTQDLWPEEPYRNGRAVGARSRGERAKRRAAPRLAQPPRPPAPPRPPRPAAAPVPPAPPAPEPYGPGHNAQTARREFMDEEKLRILKMVEDGKISATDAVSLIEALERSEKRPTTRDLKKKWLHIRVDKDGDRNVDVKIPLALLKFATSTIARAPSAPARGRRGSGRGRRSSGRSSRRRPRSSSTRWRRSSDPTSTRISTSILGAPSRRRWKRRSKESPRAWRTGPTG